MNMSTKVTTAAAAPVAPAHLKRVAVAVDSRPEGSDAAVLGAGITRAVGGDMMGAHCSLLIVPRPDTEQ